MNPQPPNGLVRMLPDIGGTAGSIVGGLLGGAGGVAGGAAIPGADLTGVPEVAGGVAGAKVGSTVGAGVGGGLGQGAEDLLTGKLSVKSIPGIAGSALENAIGNLVGEKLFQGGSALLKGAQGMLEKQATGRAEQAATDAAAKQATDEATQQQARAEAFKNNYGSISQRLQQDLKLGTNAKAVDQLGFDSTDPTHMKTVSNAGLDLNAVYDKALQGADKVDMTGFTNKIYQDMQKNGVTDLTATPLGKAISEVGIPLDQKNLSLPATQVRQLQQAVGKQIGNTQKIINNAELQGVSNTEAESQLKSLQQVYQDLGSKIKTPQVNEAIAGTTILDADRQALVAKYGDKLGNQVADQITNAKSADDLLKPMQQYKQMSDAADMATNDIENAIGTSRAVARSKAANPAPEKSAPDNFGRAITAAELLGAVPTHGMSLIPLAVQTGRNLISNPGAQDAALAAIQKVTGNKTAGSIVNNIARAGGIAGANLLNEQPQGAGGSAIPTPTPGAAGVGGANVLDQAYQDQLNAQNALMLRSAMTPSYEGGAALAGSAASLGGVVANLAPQVQKQELAAQTVAGLLPAFEQVGGAQGPVGGLLTEATSLIPGSAANTYAREQATAAATLAHLLGISPAEAQGLLPRVTQTGATAAAPVGQTGSLLNSLTVPSLALGQ